MSHLLPMTCDHSSNNRRVSKRAAASHRQQQQRQQLKTAKLLTPAADLAAGEAPHRDNHGGTKLQAAAAPPCVCSAAPADRLKQKHAGEARRAGVRNTYVYKGIFSWASPASGVQSGGTWQLSDDYTKHKKQPSTTFSPSNNNTAKRTEPWAGTAHHQYSTAAAAHKEMDGELQQHEMG